MKNCTLFILLVAVSVTAISCEKNNDKNGIGALPDPIKIELRAVEQEMVRSDQAFAFEFFEKVFIEESLHENKDFMVSPLSLSMALAMVCGGAENNTKEALLKTLKLGDYNDDEYNSYYKKLKESLLKTDPSTKLSIANAIFSNQFVTFKSDFIKVNQSFYDATVKPVDFSQPETTAIINQWASDNTNKLIEKVIETTRPEDLIYLLNAIYFKGIWTSKFDKKLTERKSFTCENGIQKKVEMMNQTSAFNYNEDQNLQMVQLPYGNQAFSMLVLLPKEGKMLQDLVTVIGDSNYWLDLKSGLHSAEVALSLPKFKTEYNIQLNDVLTKMGMGVAFTDGADFSRMSNESAKIDFVKQDTYINTDESGTEAAAVTTIGFLTTSLPGNLKKVVLNVNRPFLYIIQENSTGAILFMGAVKNFES